MLAYEIKTQDTWIFYELCGESIFLLIYFQIKNINLIFNSKGLGNSLYDLKGEGNIGGERVYRVIFKNK